MSPLTRKFILYFVVILSSALIMAWLVVPLLVLYNPGNAQFWFTRIFALVGYYGLGYWLYSSYFPRLRQRIEANGFFRF